MRVKVGLVVFSLALVVGSALSLSSIAAAPNPMAAQWDKLLAQCPPVPEPANADKLPIHVTHWGTSGPTVLIIHGGVQGGLGGGPKGFIKQRALAARGWQINLVDRPGFGESPSRGVDDMERDAKWIADMLGDGANLIGHSWGGAEALLAAARRPQAVRSLVLDEPALQALMQDEPDAMRDPAVKADAGRFMGLLMQSATPQAYGLAFTQGLGSTSSAGGNDVDVAALLKANPDKAKGLGCALLQGGMASTPVLRRAAETIAEAGVPVLVITGGWSPFFDSVGEVVARLTHGRHIVIRSPNHFIQFVEADEFNTVVDRFMREADTAKNGERQR